MSKPEINDLVMANELLDGKADFKEQFDHLIVLITDDIEKDPHGQGYWLKRGEKEFLIYN